MDSGIPISPNDFEQIAQAFYQSNEDGEKARAIIGSLGDHPYSLYIFHTLLMNSTSNEAKYLCLSVIASKINSQWNIFSEQQKAQLRSIYFGFICDWPTKDVTLPILRQLDNVLIQIIFEEWPNNWPSFILDMINNSSNNPSIMLNNIYLFCSLSEQIRNSTNISTTKKKELTTALRNDFQLIYGFLKFVFLQTQIDQIKIESLTTLAEYLSWIDLNFVEEDKIFDFFFENLMPLPSFRIPVLKCLSSVVSRETATANPLFVSLFHKFICVLSNDSEMLQNPELIPSLVIILIKFISMDRGSLLPNDIVIQWMIEYSKIVDDELFVQIIDMWHSLAKIFIFDAQILPFSNCYLFPLQLTLCSRMPKPPEYNGDKELFDKMRETLMLLFGMHRDEILHVIVDKINLPNYDESMLPFIYAIGAISGVCDENEEISFMTIIIQSLLRFMQNGNELLSQVTSAFMYIASLYPRFLSCNLPILGLSLSKHYEYFMSGNQFAQFVAVKTFINLAKNCGKIITEKGYSRNIFEQIAMILQKIPIYLHHSFFESLTYFVNYCEDEAEKQKMTVVLLNYANSTDIITELIPIVEPSFQQTIEQILQGVILNFQTVIKEEDKHQIYELFQAFLTKFPHSACVMQLINEIYNDFGKNHSYEAFDFFSILIKNGYADLIPHLFSNLLAPTFQYISGTFTEYPEIRLPFFQFIRSAFDYFHQIPQEIFTEMFHYTYFGIMHPQSNISELAMNCISTVLYHLDSNNDINVLNSFYSAFYFELLSQFFDVLFDGLHSFLFSQVTQSLHYLLQIAATGKITFLELQQIYDFICQKLTETFPNRNSEEIQFVSGEIMNSMQNCGKLRQVIKDFIILSHQVNISEEDSLTFNINSTEVNPQQIEQIQEEDNRDELTEI